MEFVNIHDAKTNLSRYLQKVKDDNEVVVICKNGTPIGQLTRYNGKKAIKIGLLKGKIFIADNFDDPLPEDIIGDYT